MKVSEQGCARCPQNSWQLGLPVKWLCLLTHLYQDELRSEAEVISHLSKLENVFD